MSNKATIQTHTIVSRKFLKATRRTTQTQISKWLVTNCQAKATASLKPKHTQQSELCDESQERSITEVNRQELSRRWRDIMGNGDRQVKIKGKNKILKSKKGKSQAQLSTANVCSTSTRAIRAISENKLPRENNSTVNEAGTRTIYTGSDQGSSISLTRILKPEDAKFVPNI